MKTTIFNLIILDESGSMSGVTEQTISGCNETLNVIRASAKENAATQNSFVSIYAFQDGGPIKSRYLVKNAHPEDVKDITTKDYSPYGNTPMLDAVGSTLSELKAISETHEDATGIVTIMTDGYENASTHYTWEKVANIISSLRELGWTINLIGANINIEEMSKRMNVNQANSMAYKADCEGTKSMWDNFKHCVANRLSNEAVRFCHPDAPQSVEERRKRRKESSDDFFKD